MDYKLTEPTQISSLLDIETLDVNLYRSRELILPPRARGAYILLGYDLSLTQGSFAGVFGGLVISQAMVAATKSVKPEYHLHVCHTTRFEHLKYLLTLPHSRCT
jgi:acyl-CoA thioesterase